MQVFIPYCLCILAVVSWGFEICPQQPLNGLLALAQPPGILVPTQASITDPSCFEVLDQSVHLPFATRIYLYGTKAGSPSPAAMGYVDVQPRSTVAVANGSSDIRSQVHGASSTGPIVGIQYSGWHGPAATTLAAIAAKGGKQLSLEEVIMSDGALDTSDIYDKYGMEGQAYGFYY